MNRRFFACKQAEEIHELTVLHPYALVVFAWLVQYCFEQGLPIPTLTSIARTPEEEAKEGAESDAHSTCRAFDVSSLPYHKRDIDEIIRVATKLFGKWGAINKEGQVRLVVYHKVTNGQWHFHFQIHRKFAQNTFTGLMP